ncbi:UNKNOWN [Stylonychia lemnae]|uniref:Uncharacterized protein n=1 Tax=Stylonychia lemnae TaxID=5949 RepID=A0A078AJA1_STYLE|nr:UNKNOWN [Stylonychia lemnae]|eukprot:CDW82380.1 UNKNOWN [Stylonychia lemnae]
MINTHQRTHTIKKISVLQNLIQEYDIDFNLIEDVPVLLANLRSLIQFQSQRFMIQEVKKSQHKLEFKPQNDSTDQIKQNYLYIKEYLASSIEIFQDDADFMNSLSDILRQQPDSYKIEMFEILIQELKNMDERTQNRQKTSADLQQKCQILYILAYITPRQKQLMLLQYLIDQMELQIDANIKYPIQERYYAMMYLCLYFISQRLQIRNMPQLQLKNKLFAYAFSGISSNIEIINRVSFNILQNFMSSYDVDNLGQLLELENGYYFHNLFSKIRYGSEQMTASHHILQILNSLKNNTPKLLENVIYDLFALVIENIDKSIIQVDQKLILLSVDISELLSLHVHDYSAYHKPEKKDETQYKDKLEEMRAKMVTKNRNLANIIRRLILRLQPYINPSTQPIVICVKTLTILKNCSVFLKDEEMFRETKHDPFSVEDSENVKIPCTLSALTYEIYQNILSIIKHPSALAHQIKAIELINEIFVQKSDFILSMKRFEDDILPSINQYIDKYLVKDRTKSIGLKLIVQTTKFLLSFDTAPIDKQRFNSAINLAFETRALIIKVIQDIPISERQKEIQDIISLLNQ